MSRTLNLVAHVLARGRKLHELGRTDDASKLLGRLGGWRELPKEVAEETQARLADMQMRRRQYHRARRHLTAALALRPNNPRYHYLMATALDLDEKGDPASALQHYRTSLALDPDQPRCLSDYGLLALSLGQDEEGLQALRRAVELAPGDPEVVGALVEGLCHLNRPEEARVCLRAALFRNPRHAGFGKLWSDFQFQQLHEAQEAARRGNQEGSGKKDGPVLLPFVRLVSENPTRRPRGRKVIRQDVPSSPAPPHTPRRMSPAG